MMSYPPAGAQHWFGLTIIEIIVLFVVVVIAAGVALPLLSRPRINTKWMESNTRLRGIHSGCVLYAQGNSDWYPGLDAQGRFVDVSVEKRFKILTDNNYFTGEYMISPVESKTIWITGEITTAHYSYAMLQAAGAGASPAPRQAVTGRISEWRATGNTQGAVLSDRNTGADAQGGVGSLHSPVTGQWRGGVAWNDNHVTFEKRHQLPTVFGSAAHADDNLFEAAGDDDAYMIHSGE